MDVCHGSVHCLPRLPLDQVVPKKILKRRGAISFSSSNSYGSYPRLERRGGISYEKTDTNALYVRMLGDVKVRTKPELAARERRKSSLQDAECLKILEKESSESHQSRSRRHLHSTQTPDKVRRRQPRPHLRCSAQNASILDDDYAGQAKCLLSTVGDWDFNIYNLDKLTNGRSLFHMSLHLFQEHNLIETFQLDIIKLMRCVSLVEEGYHSNNPYHNAVHAADVAQAMHCYLKENKLSRCLSPLEKMTAIFSALTHDLDHPGVNQSFLIATSSHLAALYKNTSVLENHHWRSALGILRESGLLDHLDEDVWNTIEWQLKSLILATDITRQQEFLSRFKIHIENNDLDLDDAEHRHFMLQIALKCADICNPCRPWLISKQWSEQVCDEFFRQGDVERKMNLPVTPTCDRHATTVAKIQCGFMQFVVVPLFKEWHRFNPTQLSDDMLQNIQDNKAKWDGIVKEAERAKETAAPAPVVTAKVTVRPMPVVVSSEEKENVSAAESDSSSDNQSIIADLPEIDHLKDDAMYHYGRRHSMPVAIIPKEVSYIFETTRHDSLPLPTLYSAMRRHSLPVVDVHRNPTSCDNRLPEKLAALAECSPTNGNRTFSFEALQARLSPAQSDTSSEDVCDSCKASDQLHTTDNKTLVGSHSKSSNNTNRTLSSSSHRGLPLQPLHSNSLEAKHLLDHSARLAMMSDRPRSLSLVVPDTQPLLPKEPRRSVQVEHEGLLAIHGISNLTASLQDMIPVHDEVVS